MRWQDEQKGLCRRGSIVLATQPSLDSVINPDILAFVWAGLWKKRMTWPGMGFSCTAGGLQGDLLGRVMGCTWVPGDVTLAARVSNYFS